MTAVGPNYVGNVGSIGLTGTTWATLTNAQGSGTGTFATWTTSTGSATATWEGAGFDVQLPANAAVDSVFVECQHKESSTTLISAVTGQLFRATNLLDANTADIETDASGWGIESAITTLTQDATHVNSGSQALNWIASGPASAVFTNNTYACTAGQSYTAGVWMYTAGASKTATLEIAWENSSGSSTGTSIATTTTLTTGAYTYIQVVGTAPASTTQMQLVVEAINSVNTDAFWIDSIFFGQPVALGSATAFTRSTTSGLSTFTVSTGVSASDVQNLRVRIAGTHSATASSGVLSIDFARITVTYHIVVPLIFGNLFAIGDQSVESGIGNWAPGTNTATLLSSGVQALDGGLSLQIKSTASGACAALFNGVKLPVTAGLPYELAFWVWSSVSTTCNAETDWYTGATFTNYDDLLVLPGALTNIVSGWNYIVLRAPAVATSNGCVPILIPTATAASQLFYCDRMYFGPPRPDAVGMMQVFQ